MISDDSTSQTKDELWMRAILDASYDAFIAIDGSGLILDWNPQAERTFGFTKEEVLGLALHETIIPDRHREQHKRGMKHYLATGVGPVLNKRIEIDALHKEGREIPVELLIYPVRLGSTLIFGSFLRDISERREAERLRKVSQEQLAQLNLELERRVEERTADLERVNEQLRSASRLKDEFLATVSHELRTPLNVIQGHSELLLTAGLSAEDLQSAAAIHRNAKSQEHIISDLLDVSRIISGKLQLDVGPIDLAAVIQGALETVKIAAESKQIEIQMHLSAAGGLVIGDPNRLQQVIWNLLSNAIKFTPAKGRVTVELMATGTSVCICIRDTGKGIEPAFLAHVFERFRQEDATTTRRFGGLGLGLAIARHIVEAHGGTIEASSEGKDRGATFTLQLPLLAATAAPHSETSHLRSLPKAEGGELNGIRVLVVDDQDETRAMLKMVLQRAGAQVTVAASSAEGLKQFNLERPHLLISDIGMPDEDGYAFLKRLRQVSPTHIPAIALTAYAQDSDRAKAIESGFQLHLTKPISPKDLIEAIARIV